MLLVELTAHTVVSWVNFGSNKKPLKWMRMRCSWMSLRVSIVRLRPRWSMNDCDAAIKALAQACRINPAWPLAMQELAASYRAVSRFDDARATMETAVRHAPADALTLRELLEA